MARSVSVGKANQVRIIAGRWRSRKIHFPDGAGLRPTPDRVRETLFNWLQFDLAGRRCLDLFAGSGVLGLEAMSRGAGHVTLVDNSAVALASLEDNISKLDAAQIDVIKSDALAFLEAPAPAPFDIVFLDPPYDSGLLPQACELLERHNCLSKHARIYLETETGHPDTDVFVPSGWVRNRTGRAGQVVYSLYEKV